MRWCVYWIFSLLLIPSIGMANDSENVKVVRAMIEAVNSRNLDALDGLIASDVVRHSAATPGVSVTSLEEFRAFLEADLEGVPDSVQEIEIIFGSGAFVAVRAKYKGTQLGPMGPFPPKGNSVNAPFMAILRLDEGKIAEIWVEWDNINILTQLGHFPPAGN